ncbi:formylglycine-generating enzyme family protein [Pseudomonas vancouverensis]|uniref:Formylglycine-generating enzyme family protein n=1 Tax=Pseudomonas vancouverensis TaxID=95300 RepID=A0A1H2NSD1_PSEVA|nr:formylglycine-generating enzyme family protein [Pseudomonas vancouverensis]KAB0491125.1 formylglycine-generating enzyme family protein [Pseudomonas vancouverensis]TDB59663.1 formylglycine-generating enzyme family protein [Pseudomonas vancouverensis]SDV08333.1 Formylglycine-generating enzyme, required for sulfatase activity, contains SUMF1/FGE domain [Pseudomonas vancouverensis]
MQVRKRRWGMVLLPLLVVGAGLSYAGYQHWRGPAPLTVGDGKSGPMNMVWIPSGEFLMGSDHKKAQPNEGPVHKVRLEGYWVDRYDVTNADFARFVAATHYVTTAERKPDWEDLKVQLPPGTPKPDDSLLVPGAMVFVGSERPVPLNDFSQWWVFVPGANWRHPTGPQSNIEGKDAHPVVQVSYADVQAYARWANKRLLTEAEWEYAARGGLEQATYAWGNEFSPDGKQMTNTWNDAQPFPVTSASTLFKIGTKPVATYPANAYGLYDMSGNVWQWVADWYRTDAFKLVTERQSTGGVSVNPKGPDDSYDPALGEAANAPQRVIRGGSFLCSDSYCTSFRTSARQGSDPANPMSHLGFRLAMSEEQWEGAH